MTAAAPADGATRSRVAAVDGVRALAALAVLATHVATVSGLTIGASRLAPLANRLNVGVAVFFVLSGYLLHRPFVAARWSGGALPSVGRYTLRRAARILPAYWVALTATALALPGQVQRVLSGEWWAYYGLLQAYDDRWLLSGLTVAWSLSTEVAFYVALPVVAWLAVRALGRRAPEGQARWELAALGASAAVALGLRALWSVDPPLPTYAQTLPGEWTWFAGGMALAVLSERVRRAGAGPALRRGARLGAPALVVGAALVLAWSAQGPWLPTSPYAFDRWDGLQEHLLFAVVGVALVGAAVLDAVAGPTPVRAVLGSPPMRWLGEISYGVFLWHLPIATWLDQEHDLRSTAWLGAATLALSLLAGAASWYLVERPLVRLATGRERAARPDVGTRPGEPALEAAP